MSPENIQSLKSKEEIDFEIALRAEMIKKKQERINENTEMAIILGQEIEEANDDSKAKKIAERKELLESIREDRKAIESVRNESSILRKRLESVSETKVDPEKTPPPASLEALITAAQEKAPTPPPAPIEPESANPLPPPAKPRATEAPKKPETLEPFDFGSLLNWDQFRDTLSKSDEILVSSEGKNIPFNTTQLKEPLQEIGAELKKLANAECTVEEFRTSVGKILKPIGENMPREMFETLEELLQKKEWIVTPTEERAAHLRQERQKDAQTQASPTIKTRSEEESAKTKEKEIDSELVLSRIAQFIKKWEKAEKENPTRKTLAATKLSELRRIRTYLTAKEEQKTNKDIVLPRLYPKNSTYPGDRAIMLDIQEASGEEFKEDLESEVLLNVREPEEENQQSKENFVFLRSRVERLIKNREKTKKRLLLLGTESPEQAERMESIETSLEGLRRVEAYLTAKEKGGNKNLRLEREEERVLLEDIQNMDDGEFKNFILRSSLSYRNIKIDDKLRDQPKRRSSEEETAEAQKKLEQAFENAGVSSLIEVQKIQAAKKALIEAEHNLSVVGEKIGRLKKTVDTIVEEHEGDTMVIWLLGEETKKERNELLSKQEELLEKIEGLKSEIATLEKEAPVPVEAAKSDNEVLQEEREKLERTKKIKEVNSVDDLYAVLAEFKEVQGSRDLFTAEELQGYIEDMLSTDPIVTLINITRTYGLRDKVHELVNAEKTSRVEKGSLEKLEKELNEARTAYLDEYTKYLKSQKHQGKIGKILSALNRSKKTESVAHPQSLIDAKEKYQEAIGALGQKMLGAKRDYFEKIANGEGKLTEDDIEILMKQLAFERKANPGTQKKYTEEEQAIRSGKLTVAQKELLLENFRKAGIYPRLVLAEEELLNQGCIENVPQKEKASFKACYEKILDKYASIGPKMKRAAVTTLIVGGLAFAAIDTFKDLSSLYENSDFASGNKNKVSQSEAATTPPYTGELPPPAASHKEAIVKDIEKQQDPQKVLSETIQKIYPPIANLNYPQQTHVVQQSFLSLLAQDEAHDRKIYRDQMEKAYAEAKKLSMEHQKAILQGERKGECYYYTHPTQKIRPFFFMPPPNQPPPPPRFRHH